MQVCTSLQTDNHAITPPLGFLQAGCPSCHPTNSVKALKANCYYYYTRYSGPFSTTTQVSWYQKGKTNLSNSRTMFNRKDCLVLLQALKAVSTLSLCLIQKMHSNLFRYKYMQAAATLIQLLNSRQLITTAVLLAVNINLNTCVNPDVIFLLQSANTRPSSTLLLLSRLMSANCTL